jgi:hypothetical protein
VRHSTNTKPSAAAIACTIFELTVLATIASVSARAARQRPTPLRREQRTERLAGRAVQRELVAREERAELVAREHRPAAVGPAARQRGRAGGALGRAHPRSAAAKRSASGSCASTMLPHVRS